MKVILNSYVFSFQESEMKIKTTILLLVITSAILALPIEITNDWLRVIMDDTTGMFTIGTIDDSPLLDGYPETTGSHFVVYIDHTSFSNEPGFCFSMPLLDPGQAPEDHYMSIQWIEDPIRIWEKLYFMPEESLNAFVNIELLAYNDSPDSANVGLSLFLDIACGANDNPVLELPTGEQTVTINFADDLPAYWTFYEHSIGQDTIYTHSQGVPFGNLMIYPDEMYFGNAARLDSAEWYPPSFLPGLVFSDISVLFLWEPVMMTPYSWYIVQVYYGAGYPGFKILEQRSRPKSFALGHPRPNPFNSRVTVPYQITDRPHLVSWNIYDLSGRIVKHTEPERLNPGKYEVRWDCRDEIGREVPAGMYLLALWANGDRETKRLVYVR